jgi:hypothetical protein
MLASPNFAPLALALALSAAAVAGSAQAQDPPKPAAVAWTVLKPVRPPTNGADLHAAARRLIVVAGRAPRRVPAWCPTVTSRR